MHACMQTMTEAHTQDQGNITHAIMHMQAFYQKNTCTKPKTRHVMETQRKYSIKTSQNPTNTIHFFVHYIVNFCYYILGELTSRLQSSSVSIIDIHFSVSTFPRMNGFSLSTNPSSSASTPKLIEVIVFVDRLEFFQVGHLLGHFKNIIIFLIIDEFV